MPTRSFLRYLNRDQLPQLEEAEAKLRQSMPLSRDSLQTAQEGRRKPGSLLQGELQSQPKQAQPASPRVDVTSGASDERPITADNIASLAKSTTLQHRARHLPRPE
jgi:hypothetical protein